MSSCYPVPLQTLRNLMSSSDCPRPLSPVPKAHAMDHLETPSRHVQNSMGNHAGLRKRKNFQIEASTSNTASLNNKRRRDSIQFSSSSPLDGGTADVSHNGQSSTHVVDTGERRTKTNFGLSCRLARSVSPPNASTGQNANIESNEFSGVHEATSVYGRSQGIQSTVTSSSTEEEEESTLLHSFGQTLKVASETGTVNLTSSTQALGDRSICRRPDDHDDHQKRGKRVTIHPDGVRRKSRIREHQHDGEVLSPLSKIFSSLSARNVEVDTVSGSTLQDVSCAKTETTCVVNSGCSSVEPNRPGRARRTTDYGSPVVQLEDSSELVHNSCIRELQGSFIDPDLCVSSCSDTICSDTMPSGLVTPYKRYQPVEFSCPHGSTATLSGRNLGTGDGILVDNAQFATDQYKGKNTEATQSSRAGSSNASKQERENHSWPPTECKSAGDDGLEQYPAPTFVLSSGRMSKDEAKKLGVRPPTIDDAFDEYFAQLML